MDPTELEDSDNFDEEDVTADEDSSSSNSDPFIFLTIPMTVKKPIHHTVMCRLLQDSDLEWRLYDKGALYGLWSI